MTTVFKSIFVLGVAMQNNLKLNDSLDSGRHSETQPLLLQQQPIQHQPIGPNQMGGVQLPLGSGGSGGSSGQQNVGGVWGAAPVFVQAQHSQSQQPIQPSLQQHPQGGTNWDMPWTGPPSGGSGSNTTYGPIYNPAAPPPSASNYVTVPHGYQQGGYMPNDPTESSYGYQPHHQSNVSSSGKQNSFKCKVLKSNDSSL